VSIPQRDLASVDYFFDPEILQDPYPYYDHARAQGPVAPGMPYDAIAITGYEEAVAVFNDPASFSNCNSMSGPFSGLVAPEGADDLRLLAAGFADLAQSRLRLSVAHPAAVLKPTGAPALASKARRIVVPAVAIERTLPPWPSTLGRPVLMTGTMRITIDATGTVTAAQLNAPINPTYDAMLMAAALTWRYQPATLDGRPTESTQVIRIDLPR